jgi:hypothetical protein
MQMPTLQVSSPAPLDSTLLAAEIILTILVCAGERGERAKKILEDKKKESAQTADKAKQERIAKMKEELKSNPKKKKGKKKKGKQKKGKQKKNKGGGKKAEL